MSSLGCGIFCVLHFGGRFLTRIGGIVLSWLDIILLCTLIMVFAVSILYLLFPAVMPHFSRRLQSSPACGTPPNLCHSGRMFC